MVFLFVSSGIKIEALHRSAASKTLLNGLSTTRCFNVRPRFPRTSIVDEEDPLFIVGKNGRFQEKGSLRFWKIIFQLPFRIVRELGSFPNSTHGCKKCSCVSLTLFSLLRRKKRKSWWRIVTGDGKSIVYGIVHCKRSWKHGRECAENVVKLCLPPVMLLSVWWDRGGIADFELHSAGETITKE